MAGRVCALIVIVLLAWFLFIALSNIAQLAESGRLGFGDFALLLFYAVVSVGFIGYFCAFFGRPGEREGSVYLLSLDEGLSARAAQCPARPSQPTAPRIPPS